MNIYITFSIALALILIGGHANLFSKEYFREKFLKYNSRGFLGGIAIILAILTIPFLQDKFPMLSMSLWGDFFGESHSSAIHVQENGEVISAEGIVGFYHWNIEKIGTVALLFFFAYFIPFFVSIVGLAKNGHKQNEINYGFFAFLFVMYIIFGMSIATSLFWVLILLFFNFLAVRFYKKWYVGDNDSYNKKFENQFSPPIVWFFNLFLIAYLLTVIFVW